MDLAEDQGIFYERDSKPTRERLLLKYLPHVKRIVERFCIHLPPSVDKDDLIQAGVVGLVEALDRFDPERGNKFITYASYRVKGAILCELRSRDFLTRTTRKRVREMDEAYAKLENTQENGVTDQDVADEMGISIEKYYEIRSAAHISFVQFDRFEFSDGDADEQVETFVLDADRMDMSKVIGLKEILSALTESIDQLPGNEKLVVSLYYQDELTMKEIGDVMGVTESRVSQIHSKAIMRLRKRLRMKNLLS